MLGQEAQEESDPIAGQESFLKWPSVIFDSGLQHTPGTLFPGNKGHTDVAFWVLGGRLTAYMANVQVTVLCILQVYAGSKAQL